MPTINLSLRELQQQLTKVSTSQAIALTAIHEPEMRQRRNPYRGKVLKRSRVNGFINFRYQTTVQKQQKREQLPADFIAAPRKWGQRVRGCPLVLHVADELQLYLEVKIERVERLYFHAETFEPIDEKQLAPYFKKRRPSRQKLNKPVELRDYRLDHVAEVRLAGQIWRVAPVSWLLETLKGGAR